MTKQDRIFNLLRSKPTVKQAQEMAKYLETRVPDVTLEHFDRAYKNVATLHLARVEKKISASYEGKWLAKKLYTYIHQSFPHYDEPDYEKWGLEFDRLARKKALYGYKIQLAVMAWIFEFDSRDAAFWRKNIRSAGTFKEKFPRLYEQAETDLKAEYEIPTIG